MKINTSNVSLPDELIRKDDVKIEAEPKLELVSEEYDIVGNTDPENHIRDCTAHYVEVSDEFTVFDAHFEREEPLLLEGPKGCGKSLAVAKWATMKKRPIITFDCSEGTKEGHLIGRLIIRGGSTPFHLGLIPTIIEIANKSPDGAVIIFEEMNSLTAQMQKLMNPLCDWRRGVFVEAVGKHYSVNKGKKLMIVGTMNPSSYGGVNELNDDLLSRFTKKKWDYPTMSDEKRILKKSITDHKVPDAVVKQFLKLAQETRAAEKRQSEAISHSISTRELDSIFNLYAGYKKFWDNPVAKLIDKVRGMYDDDQEWNIVKSRIESIFGREVFNVAYTKQSDEEIEKEASE
jgi:MoxR-like ATPase